MKDFDIAVIGAGLAGSLAALRLAALGHGVALVAPAMGAGDGRTTALMDQSIAMLRDLGLWDALNGHAAPLETMRIVDGTGRLLRAPPVSFRASEVGLPAFGYNIPNAPFLAELDRQVRATPGIERIEVRLVSLEQAPDAVSLVLGDGTGIRARLVVGADGRKSALRDLAGIKVSTWTYPQVALVLNFAHERPHGNISTEFHTESGPFTQVPLPGRRSSLVWVLSPADAEDKQQLSPDALGLAIETRMQSMLGKVTVDGTVQAFPLSGMMAQRFGKGRIALVGEAAHAFPPIGAQGLNLSLRDSAALGELVAEDSIPADVGDRFDRRRRLDIATRTASVDLLNRSLLSGFLPVQLARATGLHLLSAVGPLRSIVMREGVEPGGSFRALRESLRERVARKQA